MVPAVYNYLIHNYSRPAAVRSYTKVHKRSELRSIYSTIVNLNKSTPLYKVDLSKKNQTFALGLKDLSLQLSETAASLYSDKENSIFHALRAHSTDDSSVNAFLTANQPEDFPEPFSIQVRSLATTQKNESLSVPINSMNPPTGNYSFQIRVDQDTYSFQYKIKENTSNEDTLKRLADFINDSNIGVICSTEKPNEDSIKMTICSVETGTTGTPTFSINDTKSPSGATGLISYYGLDRILAQPSNASFTINGEEKETLSNQILLNKTLQLNLQAPSGHEVEIGYLPDSSLIKNSIKEFQSGYNAIIDLTTAYGSEQGLSKKLLSRLTDITAPYKNDLEACGLSFDDTGKMQLTDSLLTDSIESSELNPHFSSTGFLGRLGRQLNGISINPMEYVDKTLILYPNPLRTCTSPYTASKYSGMLFNYYC